MHFGDYIFIFLLGLVLFGPKKLPEIGRQAGKLLAEFRRASNEFKFQIQEEIRNMEEEERRKKLAESRAAAAAASTPAPPPTAPSILPPSTGAPVSTERPFVAPVPLAEPLPVSPHLALNSAALVSEPAATARGEEPAESTTPEAGSIEIPAVNNGSHPVAGEVAQPESVSHD
ncbi:MAG: twin-arginine translocase TatA/TatE family subunit [Acidobacteriaceae bacterium]